MTPRRSASAAAVAAPGSTAGARGDVCHDGSGPRDENDFYRLSVDPKTGGIASLLDKRQSAECVDPASPFVLNQYIYENPEGGRKAVDDMAKRAAFKRRSPPSVEAARRTGRAGGVKPDDRRRSAGLPGDRDRDHHSTTVSKGSTSSTASRRKRRGIPEAVYFAFPFRVDKGGFRFEIADGAMRPETDQLPGTTRDWQTVQHWVEFANG